MRVALIQSEMRLDTKALTVARALRRQGHQATLLVPQTVLRAWLPASALEWQAEGFSWLPVAASRLVPATEHFPKDAGLATARALASVLRTFHVAWFFERHWAMPLLRERRFADRKLPVVVLDEEPDADPIPTSLEEINRAFASRYALMWTDLVCAEEPEKTIRVVEALWRAQRFGDAQTIRQPLTSPAVTVCIPYFEAADFFAETLQSLERQTSGDFTVIAVDDGSYTAEGRGAFDVCARRYAERGWRFVRQANGSGASARNHAAREATTEFVLFLDADDIAMPNMVERFLRAALLTGDDCLVVPNYGFHRDPDGPCALLYDPPGNSLIGSMVDDMHGGGCILVRREAFLQLGGFSEIRGLGYEDYELHVRCNLESLRWDVLPELIYRYRLPGMSNVSRSSAPYAKMTRVLRWYRQRLQASGLGPLPAAVAAAYWQREETVKKATKLEDILASRRPARLPGGRGVKLLLLTCNFPYGMVSGWHVRVQQMIRYFGSRYELTLLSTMRREQLGPVRREAFQYLHAVRGVEGSRNSAAVGDDLPLRIREQYTDTFQAAIRSLPTDQFHAALIDQIFMAEFRHDIDTRTVLTEQNIESSLLRQAARRTWTTPVHKHFQDPLAEALRLERYEDRAWSDFALRSVVSEVDRAHVDSRAKRGKTVVAPNGADPSTWLPDVRFQAATFLFPAHLAYLPNVDAVDFLLTEIWPLVQRRVPRARLIIAGRDPVDAVKASVAAATGVELCINPKSMQRLARRASVTVAPLRHGSGTRSKILESMAWGLPVVSTTLGAEGIEIADGEHLLLRDNAADFVDAMVRLLSDKALWTKLRTNGRELVRERYAWDHVFEPLEDALLELIS